MSTGAAMSPVDCTSVGSDFEAQLSLRSTYIKQYSGAVSGGGVLGYVDWDSVGSC